MSNTQIVPIDKAGERVDPGAVHTNRATWAVVNTAVSAGDDPLDIGVTARGPNGKATYQLAKAAQVAGVSGDEKITFYDIPRSGNAPRFRAQGITDDGTYTVQVYAGTLGDGYRDADSTDADCELAYVGQLAWIVGTQASITTGYEMADAVTVTASDWAKDWKSASPSGNRVAEAWIDIMGADLIVIVPTVISADSKLLIKEF